MWYKKDFYGESKGHIPKRYLRKFLENAIWIADSDKIKFSYFNAVDSACNYLSVFGKTIEWNKEDYADYSMKKLIKSFGEFLDACEKNRR